MLTWAITRHTVYSVINIKGRVVKYRYYWLWRKP